MYRGKRKAYAELQAELAAAQEETRMAGVTALGMLRFVEALSEALYDLHQIGPRQNAAKRRVLTKNIHQRLEQRLQALEDDLQITLTDGTAFSVNPGLVEYLEQFTNRVQDMHQRTAQYTPATPARGPDVDDYIIKAAAEGWFRAKVDGTTREEYCQQHGLSTSTLKRYLNEYNRRRIDLLDEYGS